MSNLFFPSSLDTQGLKSEELILLAAMKVFADYPPHIASVRMIGKEAGVNYSSITYHFKSKENLYQEVIQRVIATITQLYHLPETPIEDPKTAKVELRAFFGRMIDLLYTNPYAVCVMKIVLREHLAPSAVYEQVQGGFAKILARMTDLVLCITGETDRRHATLQFFSMLGQVLGFRILREMLVRQVGFTGFSTVEIEELKTLIFTNIFRQLGVQP